MFGSFCGHWHMQWISEYVGGKTSSGSINCNSKYNDGVTLLILRMRIASTAECVHQMLSKEFRVCYLILPPNFKRVVLFLSPF